MEMQKIIHENVKRDGTFEDQLGAVETDGCIRIGMDDGCGLPGCNCSPGYWLTIMLPRENGRVEGIKVTFDSKKDMDRYLNI